MIYAFDLDGTINRYPEPLSDMMLHLKNNGHRVVVLTAVPENETFHNRERMLWTAGVKPYEYDDLVLVPDDGVSKGKYCAEHKVDVLIDDAQANLENCRRLSPNTLCLRVMP